MKPIIKDKILLILILLNVFIIYLHSFDSFKFYYNILGLLPSLNIRNIMFSPMTTIIPGIKITL